MTRRTLLLACLALTSSTRLCVAGNGRFAQEYSVKAAFLFYLAQFVTWPESTLRGSGPVVFGVYGTDPFGEILDQTLAKQTIAGKNIVVQRITKLQDAPRCQVLFVSSSEEAQLPIILEALRNTSTLTVGELGGFTARGGMVGFVDQGNKVRFSVNLRAMAAAHLKASSQMLGLALGVER